MIATLERIDENKSFVDNKRLIYKVIHDMHLEIDKYYDIAMIGFVRALKTYNSEKSKIGTYFYKCIKNEILMNLRKRKTRIPENQILSLNKTFDLGKNCLSYEETIVDERVNILEEIEFKEMKSVLQSEILNLKKEEQFVINRLFGMNGYETCKQNELASLMNLSQATISRIKKKAIIKLRERMMRRGY